MRKFVLTEVVGMYLNSYDKDIVPEDGDWISIGGVVYEFRKEGKTFALIPVE